MPGIRGSPWIAPSEICHRRCCLESGLPPRSPWQVPPTTKAKAQASCPEVWVVPSALPHVSLFHPGHVRLVRWFVLEKVEIMLSPGGAQSLTLLISVMSLEILAGRTLCNWVCDSKKRK